MGAAGSGLSLDGHLPAGKELSLSAASLLPALPPPPPLSPAARPWADLHREGGRSAHARAGCRPAPAAASAPGGRGRGRAAAGRNVPLAPGRPPLPRGGGDGGGGGGRRARPAGRGASLPERGEALCHLVLVVLRREGEMGGRQGGLRLRAAGRPPSARTRARSARSTAWAGRSAGAKGPVGLGGGSPASWKQGFPWASTPPRVGPEPVAAALPGALLGLSHWGSWSL